MSYFRFEVHHGNNNDNHISEFIMEAKNLEECWVRIKKDLQKRAKEAGINDLYIDEDELSLTSIYYQYYDESGNEIECPEEGELIDTDTGIDMLSSIPFHEDYYFEGEYSNEDEAVSDMSSWHGRWSFDG